MDQKFFSLIIGVLILAGLLGSGSRMGSSKDDLIIEEDEYEVYSTVLLQMAYLQPPPELFVVKQLTSNREKLEESIITYFEKNAKVKIDASLIDDFKKKNAKNYELENKFSLPQGVVLISKQEQDKIYSGPQKLDQGLRCKMAL